MIVEKDGVNFSITSSSNIFEVGDISKTKEWEYKNNGSVLEVVKSNFKLIISSFINIVYNRTNLDSLLILETSKKAVQLS